MDNPASSPSTVFPPAPEQCTTTSTSSQYLHSESTSLEPTASTTTSPTPASSSLSIKILKPAAKGAKQQQRQPSPSSSNSFSGLGSTGTKNQAQAQSQSQRRMILQNSVSAPAVGNSTPASTTPGSQPALSRVSSSSSASVASSSIGGTNGNAGGDTQVDPQILEALKSKDRLYVLKLGEIMEGLIKEGRDKAELTPSTSYQRLLVHRCSGYYKLTPESDTGNKSIFVHLNTDSRVPPRRLCELIPAEEASLPAFKIMRRSPPDYRSKSHSHPSSEGGDLSDPEPSEAGSLSSDRPFSSYPYNRGGGGSKKRLTIEEREAAYNQARSRIFMGFDENASATSNTSSGGKDRDMSASSSSLSLASRTSGSASAGGSSVFGDFGDESSTNASEWSGSVGGQSHSQSGHSQSSQQHQAGRRGGAASFRSHASAFQASGSSGSRAPSPGYGTMYEMPPQGYDPAHGGHVGYMPPPQYYYPPYPVPPPPHAYAPAPYGYYGPGAYGTYGEGGGGEEYYAAQGQGGGQSYGGYGGYYWPPPQGQPGSGSQVQMQQQPGTPQQQPAQAYPPHQQGSPGASEGSSPAPPNTGPTSVQHQHQHQHPHPYPNHPYAPYTPYGYPYYPPPPTEDIPLYPGQVGAGAYPGYGMPPAAPASNERRLWTPSSEGGAQGSPVGSSGSQGSTHQVGGSGREKEGGRKRGRGAYAAQGQHGYGQYGQQAAGHGQRDDNARQGPGTRRQSDNSARSDEASSIASYSSSTSSSSIRTAASQHPLPPRPDWAVGLKPNGGFGTHNNVHGGSGSGPSGHGHNAGAPQTHGGSFSPNHNTAQLPTSISDFPPLTTQGQAQERKPVTAGAWNNQGVKPVSTPWNTGRIAGGEGEGLYERPPPKGPTELFNPRVGQQNGNANQYKAVNGTGTVRGMEGLAGKMQGMLMNDATASPAVKDVSVSS